MLRWDVAIVWPGLDSSTHKIINLSDKNKTQAKRSQHANATYRNIAGRNMLRAFGHRVATGCDMLAVVGSSLKPVKFEPTTPSTLQHAATR